MTDAHTSPPAAQPKSNRSWLIVGGVVLVCCCLAALAAIVLGPTISGLFGSGGGLYSGRADDVLKHDVLQVIANYELAQHDCSEVSLLLGSTTVSPEQSGDGSWTEMWQVMACNASHLYSISFVPSPQGGTDFSVTPLEQ